ncbi:BTAD domain-containing putative transcriptional regulator [Nonomuraea sp. NPDC004297]
MLEIRCLGPMEIEVDGVPVKLAGQRRLGVLARLALAAGQIVPTGQLLADVWPRSSPATAVKQLHIVVSKLRETFAAHADTEIIETVPGGYRLVAEPEQVDAHVFIDLVKQARAACAVGATEAADPLFRAALGLWRGQALAESDAPWARTEAARLDEERLEALDDHADLRLAAGDHRVLIGDLAGHVRAHPLRERTAAQLMLALYRDARASEALEVYQGLRRAMVADLGVEPGDEVRRLHQAVLTMDPGLDLAPARRRPPVGHVAPTELPADIQAFTARTAEMERLRDDLLNDAAVIVIDGPGGIGKSALAVHVAHTVAGRFADGVVYVNLHGSTAGFAPLAPIEALRHLLRSLGLDGAGVPADAEEAAARFRSLTAAADLLVILDNARDVRQVRPLIPAGRGCRVMITSRDPLTTLNNARRLRLGAFDDTHAATLLARVGGAARVHAESRAAEEIVRLCGGFPLALRIAGARLVARPDWSLADLAVRLADATRRLDLLEYADLAVRASVAVSHQHLREEPAGQDAARLLPLLGLLDLPTHTPATTAALAGWSVPRAEAALEHLMDARLLEPAGPGRYQFHDLVGLYAREQSVPAEERSGAAGRVLQHYLATSQRACTMVNSPNAKSDVFATDRAGEEIATLEAANNWLDNERDNLLAAVRQAAREGDSAAAGLADALQWLFNRRGWFVELIEVSEEVLRRARQDGDLTAQAYLLQGLASAHQQLGRFEESISLMRAGLTCFDQAGLPDRKAGILNDLGITYTVMNRYDDAFAALAEALLITERTGRRDHQAYVLNNRAQVYHLVGRSAQAVDEARLSLAMAEELDSDTGGLGLIHDTLADSLRAHGLLEEAVEEYRRGIKLLWETGYAMATAVSHWWLGHTLNDLGRKEEGRAAWRASLEILRESRLLTAAEVKGYLAQPVPETPEPIRNQV